ncbi:MAG: LysR family transcriptional regulator [Parasporobacterium sp.]|nr:LysR family transcriptional regulator [Parasporobacterium sp.]
MNQRQLEIVKTLAETLNFTKTAELLFLSQTTVTLQIHNLEEELQVRLFDRTSRSVKLTPAGQTFYEGAKKILALMQKTADETTFVGQGFVDMIKIGFADEVNATRFSAMIRLFSAEYPKIQFRIYGGYPEDLINQLLSDQYDLILVPSFSGLKTKKWRYCRLGSFRSVAAFHKTHSFAKKRRLKLSDFDGENYIYISGSNIMDFTGDFMHRIDQAGVNLNVFARTDNIDAAFFMLDAGLGVTVLPEYFIGRFAGTSDIKTCPISEDLKATDFYAVWKPKKQERSMEQLITYIENYYK